MKQTLIALITLIAINAAAFAQQKPLETAKIKTPEIRCEVCKNKVETYLKRIDGVRSISTNINRGELTVKYLTDRTNIEEIKTAIANNGFDADDIPANEDSYKRLPISCKKNEDGGGHPKPKAPAPAPAEPQQ